MLLDNEDILPQRIEENFDSFIKLDVSSFYASIKHDVLLRKLRGKIKKPEIIDLIQNAIETESLSYPVKEKVNGVFDNQYESSSVKSSCIRCAP